MFSWKRFIFAVLLLGLTAFAVVVFYRIASDRNQETVVTETAKSGILKVGVENAHAKTAADIVPVFGRYYPDASIELEVASFEDLFNRFLRKEIGGMLMSGLPGEHEASLLQRAKIRYRLEPVAKNAIVCIVNADNPLQDMCLEDLVKIYTAKKSRWDTGEGIRACINRNDIRLQQQLLAISGEDGARLRAWYSENDEMLVRLVAKEKRAVGIVPLSSVREMMSSPEISSSIRMLALCRTKGETSAVPTQFTVYSGEYPLGYIVYYMYRKEKSLAAGFGAWLAEEGQKGFMRSFMAPYRQPVRTIHIK